MAKIKYSQNINDSNDFGMEIELSVKSDGTRAVLSDVDSDAKIILKGKNLAASDADANQLGGGTVQKIVITDADHKPVVTVSNISIKAAALQDAWNEGGLDGASIYMTKGNDRVFGSKEDDFLLGSRGNDVMTGGAGSDYFIFHFLEVARTGEKTKPEHDVITDFDIKGSDKDYLAPPSDFTTKAVNNGHDLQLTFEDHSTLVLEGIKKAAFVDYYHHLNT